MQAVLKPRVGQSFLLPTLLSITHDERKRNAIDHGPVRASSLSSEIARIAPLASATFSTSRARGLPTSLHYRSLRSLVRGSPLRVRRGSRGFQNNNRALPHHSPAKRREIPGPPTYATGFWRTGRSQTARRLLGQTKGRWWHVQKSNLPRAAQGIGVIGRHGSPF